MKAEQAGVQGTSGYTRRGFLQGTVGGVALAGVGGVLAACSSSSGPSTTTGGSGGKPKRGGTITLASSGGSSADTLDGNNALQTLDFARAPQLYDTLMELDAHNIPQLHLADEVTPNKDATEWTIRVKKGVEFHNGKTLTADDVLYTFRRIITNKFSASSGLAYMNLAAVKKLDNYTLRIPMHTGYSILPITLVGNGEISIVPQGYDPKNPVGTGPFKADKFSPGVSSTFTRNPHYFISGKPYVDSVVIVDYSDETAQVNALTSGQATCADQLSNASVAGVRSGGMIAQTWRGPGWVPFTMRLDVAPFNDPNVRQALRLCVDRPTMDKVVYGGYGFVGNDIFGRTDPAYATSGLPQRHQDIAQAKSLLKKSGKEGLTVTLVTAPIRTGAVQLATVLKQQASQAGITINLRQVTSTDFFGKQYLKWPFAQDWWSGFPYLRQAGYSMTPGAPWDETHWDTSKYGPAYIKLYKQGLATADESTRNDIIHELMKMDYDTGGYIIPVFNPVIVGQAPNMKGVTDQTTGDPWIEYHFRDYWLA